MSQTTLETPDDLLRFQLRTTLTMERDSLAAVEELAGASRSAEVKKLFRHHADETKEQIANVTRVFDVLEMPVSTAGSPSTKGISRQARTLIEKTTSAMRDVAALSAALGNEHYEIAVYRTLITAVPDGEAASLLQANLDQEVHTSEELLSALRDRAT